MRHPDKNKSNSFTTEYVWKKETAHINKALYSEKPDREKGIALSGGGIRAAEIALGFLHELNKQENVKQYSYISSVSGGGYAAGAFLARLNANSAADKECVRSSFPYFRIGLSIIADFLANTSIPFGYAFLFLLMWWTPKDPLLSGPFSYCAAWLALIILFILFEYASRKLIRPDDGSVTTTLAIVILARFFTIALFSLALARSGLQLSATFVVCAGLIVVLHLRLYPHRPLTGLVRAFFTAFYLTIVFRLMWWLVEYFGAVWAERIGSWLSPSFPDFQVATKRDLGSLFTIAAFVLSCVLLWGFMRLQRRLCPRLYRIISGEAVISAYSSYLARAYLSSHDPKQLKLASLASSVPYPIFNATASDGKGSSAIEIAPLFSGLSEQDHYWQSTEWIDLSLSETMAISGSAVDLASAKSFAVLVSPFIAGTSRWIPRSPNHPSNESRWVVHLTAALRHQANTSLRLSDGGFTDNLGVLPLLRRRVAQIVCLDCSYDPHYLFNDFQKLCAITANRDLCSIRVKGDMAAIGATFRFASATSGLVIADILYPDNGHGIEHGKLILVKLYPAGVKSAIDQFPHVTTLDQSLDLQTLESLRQIGSKLGKDYCQWNKASTANSAR